MSCHTYLVLHAWGQARLGHQALKEVLRVHLDLRARPGLGPCYLTSLPSCQGYRSPACYHRTYCPCWVPLTDLDPRSCQGSRNLRNIPGAWNSVSDLPNSDQLTALANAGFLQNFEYKFPDLTFSNIIPRSYSGNTTVIEMKVKLKQYHQNIKNIRIKISEWMSKDQVWKITSFFILTDQKTLFQAGKMTKHFSILSKTQ